MNYHFQARRKISEAAAGVPWPAVATRDYCSLLPNCLNSVKTKRTLRTTIACVTSYKPSASIANMNVKKHDNQIEKLTFLYAGEGGQTQQIGRALVAFALVTIPAGHTLPVSAQHEQASCNGSDEHNEFLE